MRPETEHEGRARKVIWRVRGRSLGDTLSRRARTPQEQSDEQLYTTIPELHTMLP